MKYTVPLRKSGDFSRVYKKGRYYVGRHLILYVLSGAPNINALGVTASKKVGKSVRRNRLRRLAKENYRLFETYIATGFLFVFVIRKGLPDFADVSRDMRSLFLRAGVFDDKKWEISHKKV